MSNTTLALLTALIVVIGAVGPAIKQLFEVQDSKIKATFVSDDDDGRGASFLISNDGTRMGTVSAARVTFEWQFPERQLQGSELFLFLPHPNTGGSPMVAVKPLETQLLHFRLDERVGGPTYTRMIGTPLADILLLHDFLVETGASADARREAQIRAPMHSDLRGACKVTTEIASSKGNSVSQDDNVLCERVRWILRKRIELNATSSTQAAPP